MARLRGDATAARDHTEMGVTLAERALSLEEAISREKALSEILRIISRSHGDVDTVMPSILPYALELCDAEFGILFEYTTDAKFRSSFTPGIPDAFQFWLDEQGEFTARPETGLGRVEASQGVVNIIDVRAEAIYQTDRTQSHATAVLGGARSFVAIPMLAADRLVGAFTIYRKQVRPFNEATPQPARIFADQSVIALENARLLALIKENVRPAVAKSQVGALAS